MKKFIISSEILKKALGKLSNAISDNHALPVLSNILCKVGSNTVEFIASDTELTIFHRCDCETSGDAFEFLVPYQLISKIVSFNKNAPISFFQDKKAMRITGENDVYELKTLLPVTDFPNLSNVPKKTSMQLSDEVLDLLATALETVGKDENKPQLHKVLLELKSAKTTVASTDSQFVVFSYSVDLPAPEEEDLLISAKVIKSLKGLRDVKLYWHQKAMAFETKDVTLLVTRPAQKYLNFRAIFPQDYPANLTLDRIEFMNALEKCNISSDPFKATVIDLKSKEGTIGFVAKDSVANIEINVEIPGNYGGAVNNIKINSEKMTKLLHQVDFDKVEVAIHDAMKAIVLTSSDHAGYISLLMPLS